MKIAVVGTRGFPDVQGGVEMHCENLYPRLAKIGCDVTVFTRKPYVDTNIKNYDDVKLVSIDCPKIKSLEAIAHTFKGIRSAKALLPDVLHVHAVGPSLLIPFARMQGMKVVMTNHGPDYKRKKWGFIARAALRLGEAFGSIFANEIICISQNIADDIAKKYHRKPHVIPNGVKIPEVIGSDEALKKYGLYSGKYILAVGRFVPEKGFGDLIDAFKAASLDGWKLVIAGAADHATKYSREFEDKAKNSKDVILTGFLSGKPLQELYSNSGFFVLPSYYEGLPIVLLEAMSYGLMCVASDIPANRAVSLPSGNYFPSGDITKLSEKLRQFSSKAFSRDEADAQVERLRKQYDWGDIAVHTLEVYKKVLA